MRNKLRMISTLLLILMIIQIIPMQAIASGFSPVDGVSSAGGSNKSPKAVSPNGAGGVWNSKMQGLRITVIGYDGAPAFSIMGKDHLDLLFSTNKLSGVDYFGDEHKLGMVRNVRDSLGELNSFVTTIDGIKQRLDNGTMTTSVPNPSNLKKAISQFTPSRIPYPLQLSGGHWRTYGNEIKSVFYGKGDKIDNTALMYVIMNLKSKDKAGKYLNLWQPKSDAFMGFGRGFTSQELSDLKSGKITPIELMAKRKLVVTVEPIIWNKLRISKNQYSYGVYGTQTAVGSTIDWLESGGWFRPSSGKNVGGYDLTLFGRMGRRSMKLEGRTFQFQCYRDHNGKFVDNHPWDIGPPKDNKQLITNKQIAEIQPGWSLHMYLFNNGASETSTFDSKQGNIPHQAPDPKDIPATKGEDITKRKINIIKTYEDDDVHVGTYLRDKNPQLIRIEDEIDYIVDEWFISKDYVTAEEETTWTEIKDGAAKGLNGTNQDIVEVKEPNTTLYVKLIKGERKEENGFGDITIEESQITKAIDTMNTSIIGWGPLAMNFNYDSLSGSCTYQYSSTSCSSDGEGGQTCSTSYWDCGNSYVLKDTSFDYNFKNIEPIKDKLQVNTGIFKALNTKGADSKGNRGTLNSGVDPVNSFNYQMVLWRGKDIPTIANYKESSSNPLNALLNKYNNKPVGARFKGKEYIEILSTELSKDESKGDYITTSSCPTHSNHGLTSTATNLNNLKYAANVKVKTYLGKAHNKGNAVVEDTGPITATLVGKPVNVKFSGGTAINSPTKLDFYPYFRMTYQKPAMKENERINVNVLSQWLSELYPNSYAEAAWGSTMNDNLNISSAQWSSHRKATNGDDGWQGNNRVLPGGAIFNLDTKKQNTYASVVTWQPYLENEVASKVVTAGAGSYKLADTLQPHKELENSAKNALDNWRVVQYVEKNTKAATAFNGLKVAGGGESLGSLGLNNKSSTDAKYYFKPADQGSIAGQGDLDIINTTETDMHYKVKADVEGNIKVYRKRDTSDWEEIDSINKAQGISSLNSESTELEKRTKIISNLITVLTRNEGDDKTASWATSDGKWYNEAFDGICYIRKETSFEVGFRDSSIRTAALDPNLTPANKGQRDLFSKGFISQFRMNDKSDAFTDKRPGYVGMFKGQEVVLPGAENMYRTRVFSVPNVNVQDLR